MIQSGEFALFRDRHDAGQRLARKLLHYKEAGIRWSSRCLAAGLWWATTSAWRCDSLWMCSSRKLGAPSNPELAMGALAETGYRHMNEDVIREYHVSKAEVDEEILCQESEVRRRIERYRGGRTLSSLKGQTVILVDDGIATGATFYASLGALLKAETARIVAAVTVAPPRVLAEFKMLVDEVVVLHTSEWFFGIGQFYEQFPQVEDEEVITCLEKIRRALTPGGKLPA